jgi:hypothetical protein
MPAQPPPLTVPLPPAAPDPPPLTVPLPPAAPDPLDPEEVVVGEPPPAVVPLPLDPVTGAVGAGLGAGVV